MSVNIHNDFLGVRWIKENFEKNSSILGKGGFGLVYNVKYRKKEQEFAMKIMEIPDLNSFNSASHEIINTRSLEHPNIVKVIDHYFFSNSSLVNGQISQKFMIFYVMEKTQGNLWKMIKEKKYIFKSNELLDFAKSMICALDMAHEKKIIHNDIKPENILIFESKEEEKKEESQYIYKIADWGAGYRFKIFNRTKTHFKDGMGFTEAFCAPEIRECENQDDFDSKLINFYKGDTYSLGLTILACTGFDLKDLKILSSLQEKDHHNKLEAHFQKIKENYDNRIIEILRNMLQYDGEKRISLLDNKKVFDIKLHERIGFIPAMQSEDEKVLIMIMKIVIAGNGGVGKSERAMRILRIK